jgi:MFS family permease
MGFALFMASFVCVNATSLEVMVIGRILQGIGLSAPRTMSIAIIRDMYSGDYMARIMSFVTVVFILVPVIAQLWVNLFLTITTGMGFSIFRYFQYFGFVVVLETTTGNFVH